MTLQDAITSFFGVLAILFGWLAVSSLGRIAARVESLSMTVRDLRQDLDGLKDHVKTVQDTIHERASSTD